MTTKWMTLGLGAAIAVLAFGCSSDDTEDVVGTGGSVGIGGTGGSTGGSGGSGGSGSGGRTSFQPVPVAYWAMESFSGDDVLDQVGTIDGTVNGGVTLKAGQVGQAIELDGETGYVDFGDSLDDVWSGEGAEFSVAFWVNVTEARTIQIFGKSAPEACAPGNYGMAVRLRSSGATEIFVEDKEHENLLSYSGGSIADLTWTHVAWTYDGTLPDAERLKLYIDGDQVSIEDTGSFGSQPIIDDVDSHLGIGVKLQPDGQPCIGDNFYAGRIDELGVWDSVLSASDVDRLHQLGASAEPIL
jgi:hypothetical protein